MSYYRFDPFRGMEQVIKKFQQMSEEIEKGITVEYGSFSPRIDISEDEKNLYLVAELPGISKEDVKVSINEDNYIFIKGIKKRPFDTKYEAENGEVQKEERTYIKAERSYGDFSRSFILPDNINKESISAQYDNGLLKVTLEKIEPAKPKEVEISIS
ncbi:MAG: Hsp20/alpha crystallin family protein [Candidatus Kapabacteria bacterium]|nr:Hsp20/alpha crystallin family protein [Ignavibacteriota bacterium]MCW5884656.1 Hsp20/alpha crystallin family protein [Candidatus Kapabacteria bacterium]